MPAPRPSVTSVLTGTVAALCLALLVGARVGAIWAGGTGVARGAGASVYRNWRQPGGNWERLTRGATVTTTEGYDLLALDEPSSHLGQVYLAPRTSVTVLDNSFTSGKHPLRRRTVSLLGGSVWVQGDTDVTVRDINVHVEGDAMLTNYSWKYELDVFALSDKPVIITRGAETWTLNKNEGARINVRDASLPVDTSLQFSVTDNNRRLLEHVGAIEAR